MTYWDESVRPSLRPLKHCCHVNPAVLPETTEPDWEFDYIDISSVSLSEGVTHKEHMRFSASPSRARKPVREGDVLVSTVRTYLKAIAAIEPADTPQVASTGFAVLRANKGTDARFLYRVVQSNPFVEQVVSQSTGVSYPAINPSTLSNIEVPLPNLATQRQIADFLDRETARIDLLIEKKQRLVEVMKTKLDAKILNLITTGEDKNEIDQQVDLVWKKGLPKHWQARKVKHLFRLVAEPAPKNNDLELLSIYTAIGVRPRKDLEAKGNKATTTDGYWKVKKGDIIVNKLLAWMGAIGLSDYEGVTSPAYDILRAIRPLEGYYYHYLFRIPRFSAELKRHSRGIMEMRLRLYFESFGRILVPVPPLEEQQWIVSELRREEAEHDELKGKVEQSIDRLKEYRSAMITAAVTGQIDVKTYAKSGTPDRRLNAIQEEIGA